MNKDGTGPQGQGGRGRGMGGQGVGIGARSAFAGGCPMDMDGNRSGVCPPKGGIQKAKVQVKKTMPGGRQLEAERDIDPDKARQLMRGSAQRWRGGR